MALVRRPQRAEKRVIAGRRERAWSSFSAAMVDVEEGMKFGKGGNAAIWVQ